MQKFRLGAKGKAKAKKKPILPKGIDSKYELEYLHLLRKREYDGEILAYHLKPGSLRLGTGLHYEPDFLVVAADGTLEYHEVKGKTRFAEKGVQKVKSAAHVFPCFRFVLCMGQSYKNELGRWSVSFNLTEIE